MKVLVYVEGPSDKAAMTALLKSLIEQKRRKGIYISFVGSPKGDKKYNLLTKVPQSAANIIMSDSNSIVVVVPDLFPKNKGFLHETYEELKNVMLNNFVSSLTRKRRNDGESLKNRFQVFCFKYDLEVLLLAAEESLRKRLGIPNLKRIWILPIENQDHNNPPKYIIETLFKKYGRKYVDTVDAPMILGACNYHDIANQCPQCFKPFVDFLENL